jgi:hypothetical protein
VCLDPCGHDVEQHPPTNAFETGAAVKSSRRIVAIMEGQPQALLLLPPPTLSECRHGGLARRFVAVRRPAILMLPKGDVHIHGVPTGGPHRCGGIFRVRAAARALGLNLRVIEVRAGSDFEAAFAAAAREGAQGLYVSQNPFFFARRAEIAAMTAASFWTRADTLCTRARETQRDHPCPARHRPMPSRAASRRADASGCESAGLAPGTTRIVTRLDAKHPAEYKLSRDFAASASKIRQLAHGSCQPQTSSP